MDADKASARRRMQETLRATSPEQRAGWSDLMRARLTASPAWFAARTVMIFAALRSEPDLLPLLDTHGGENAERRFLFPSMENDRIVPRTVRKAAELITGPHGIRQPDPARAPVVETVDLVLVPGLAFSRDGTRLGRGRGHYDRFLAALPAQALRCGVCFECQVSDALPAEPHDVAMHLLLTEQGLTHCGEKSRLPAREIGA